MARRDSPGRSRRLTLRRRWAADGRLRAEWDQTALIVAKIHNAHYAKPVQPWEIGPYAADPEERKPALGDVAGLLKGLPGVTLGSTGGAGEDRRMKKDQGDG